MDWKEIVFISVYLAEKAYEEIQNDFNNGWYHGRWYLMKDLGLEQGYQEWKQMYEEKQNSLFVLEETR